MPSRQLLPRSLATLLALAGIFVLVVAVSTALQASHQGIPTGTAGSQATPSGASLYVDGIDGPPVEVRIGGRLVASVPCAGGALLVPGQDDVPGLPWSLDVRRTGGPLLQHYDLASLGHRTLLLRGDTIVLGAFAADGPAPASDACARWTASPGPSPSAQTVGPLPASAAPAVWWPQGPRTCGNPGFYRTASVVWSIGDCAGNLIDPPPTLTLRVGQAVELHMTLSWPEGSAPPQSLDPVPTSTDPNVLRRVSLSADGSTATYRGEQTGRAVLVSSGYCIHDPTMTQMQGPCPVLAVRVTP